MKKKESWKRRRRRVRIPAYLKDVYLQQQRDDRQHESLPVKRGLVRVMEYIDQVEGVNRYVVEYRIQGFGYSRTLSMVGSARDKWTDRGNIAELRNLYAGDVLAGRVRFFHLHQPPHPLPDARKKVTKVEYLSFTEGSQGDATPPHDSRT